MKWASVKVPAPMRFVCSQGASHMHRRPSVTPVPFPSLIRNYWVDSFCSIRAFIKKKKKEETSQLFSNWYIRQADTPASFEAESQSGDGMVKLTLSFLVTISSFYQ